LRKSDIARNQEEEKVPIAIVKRGKKAQGEGGEEAGADCQSSEKEKKTTGQNDRANENNKTENAKNSSRKNVRPGFENELSKRGHGNIHRHFWQKTETKKTGSVDSGTETSYTLRKGGGTRGAGTKGRKSPHTKKGCLHLEVRLRHYGRGKKKKKNGGGLLARRGDPVPREKKSRNDSEEENIDSLWKKLHERQGDRKRNRRGKGQVENSVTD